MAHPGVPEGLIALRTMRHELVVVASKLHVYALEIPSHFDLRNMFVGVYGSELSGEHGDKVRLTAPVIGEA